MFVITIAHLPMKQKRYWLENMGCTTTKRANATKYPTREEAAQALERSAKAILRLTNFERAYVEKLRTR